jgi:FkbM family methyltransferase
VIVVGVWKPWYVYRPHQLAKRMMNFFGPSPESFQRLQASWGADILANPREHVGRCLQTIGVFDLAVSEVLLRLIRPGDLVIDAGANVGYMTVLAAVAAGPSGRVVAFEPNPHLLPTLRQNMHSARERFSLAAIDLRTSALGSHRHDATFVLPPALGLNDGLGYIAEGPGAAEGASTLSVAVEPLDDILAGESIGMLKIDVEGYEPRVLEGAAGAIRAGRIRNIVFEEHQGSGGEAVKILESAGYTLFSIGWQMRGPVLSADLSRPQPSTRYEAPSFLATREPDAAVRACAGKGWRALRRQTRPRLPIRQ